MTSGIQKHLKQRRPVPSVEEEVFLALHILADRLMAPWAAYLRATVDLTPVQYNVLRILRGAGPDGLWICEIGERLITRSPDVTRLVDRLERRGLVERTASAEDRRAVSVRLADAGRRLIAPLDAKGPRILRSVLDGVPKAELSGVRDRLVSLLDALPPPG